MASLALIVLHVNEWQTFYSAHTRMPVCEHTQSNIISIQ